MAMDLGRDFPQRWLAAPDHYRQYIVEELQRLCGMLDKEADLSAWQQEQIRRPAVAQPDPQLIRRQLAQHQSQASASAAKEVVAAELRKRFLREADDLIEQALEPARKALREWLYQEMQHMLQGSPGPSERTAVSSNPTHTPS